MTYQLTFFCKGTEEETAAAAMDRVLDALLKDGLPLLGEYLGPPEWLGADAEAIHSFRLATESTGDYLLLELRVGMRFVAEDVIAADPNNDHGVWGSDLIAVITLSGARPDWPLVERIWTALENLWPTVPWDELSGFALATDTSRPLRGD